MLAICTFGTFPSLAAPAQTQKPMLPGAVQQLGKLLFGEVLAGKTTPPSPLLFPYSAYVTLKVGQISRPDFDYAHRIMALFDLDLLAYHEALGRIPATYIGVIANANAERWIPAGDCENNLGYWHEPSVRILYTQGGVLKSFAIDSLISWQGRFYVIHLGPNPRARNIGTVDAFSIGRGAPGPSGGC
jgi:hypothetical protein